MRQQVAHRYGEAVGPGPGWNVMPHRIVQAEAAALHLLHRDCGRCEDLRERGEIEDRVIERFRCIASGVQAPERMPPQNTCRIPDFDHGGGERTMLDRLPDQIRGRTEPVGRSMLNLGHVRSAAGMARFGRALQHATQSRRDILPESFAHRIVRLSEP